MGQKPRSPASLRVSEPLLTPATPMGGCGFWNGRMWLPGGRVVLADPRLAEAELVGPAELLEIPLVSVVEVTLGWMRRHREQSVVHVRPLLIQHSPRTARLYQSSREASRAPSARLASFAHTMSGSTAAWPTQVPNPQSVPAMTFSRPARRA